MFYRFADTQTKNDIAATQHKLLYNNSAMQYDAAQHWQYRAILGVNAMSNTCKFAEMAHLDSFGDDFNRNPYDSDSESG